MVVAQLAEWNPQNGLNYIAHLGPLLLGCSDLTQP